MAAMAPAAPNLDRKVPCETTQETRRRGAHLAEAQVGGDGVAGGDLALEVGLAADAQVRLRRGALVGQHPARLLAHLHDDAHRLLVQHHQVVQLVLPKPAQSTWWYYEYLLQRDRERAPDLSFLKGGALLGLWCA